MQSQYFDVYSSWENNPEAFWKSASEAIDWFKEPDAVFDANAGVYGRWFVGGETNTCYNCLDRHVAAGNGDRLAFIHDSAMTGAQRSFTYSEVLAEVKAIATVMRISASVTATGSLSTCRWCRKRSSLCSPARGSVLCIPWCSAVSRHRNSQHG